MSSEPEKDKERSIQAAEILFFHRQDLVPFINKLVELSNLTIKTQILPLDLKEDIYINDFFDQMIKIFEEMQLIVDIKQNQMQKVLLYFKLFRREETKEQPGAMASEKSMNLDCPKAISEDASKKLKDALRTENAHKDYTFGRDLVKYVQLLKEKAYPCYCVRV
ncbi:hypothetical protein STEG23_001590 [Scotinomys teguina]